MKAGIVNQVAGLEIKQATRHESQIVVSLVGAVAITQCRTKKQPTPSRAVGQMQELGTPSSSQAGAT